ncbi:hypothetical protein Tco_0088876 [Tanacetum coccineum]
MVKHHALWVENQNLKKQKRRRKKHKKKVSSVKLGRNKENQKFNFSLMIMNGMLGHISNGTPFLMYPRFVQLFLNKQLEGVDRPQDFIPSISLPSKVFTFMRKHSTKFSCRITPLTPSMLEVVTALAAEEDIEQSSILRLCKVSARDASKGSPTQSAAHSQRTASVQEIQGLLTSKPVVKHHAFWVESQNLKKQKRRRKKHKKKVSSVKLGRNKDEEHLCMKRAQCSRKRYNHQSFFFDDIADKDAAVTPDLERKSDETEEVNIEEKEASNVKSGETEELDLETTQVLRHAQLKAAEVLVAISRPRGLSIPGPIQSQPQQPTQGTDTQGTDPKDKGKGILVEEPKKKKLTLQQIRALETTNDEEVARKIQAEWDAEEDRKRGYKNLQKLKNPQMKELYTKFKHLLKDVLQDFIPMDSEKTGDVEGRDAKMTLKERGKLQLLKNSHQIA